MEDEIKRLEARFRLTPILCVHGRGDGAELKTIDALGKYLLIPQQATITLGMPVTLKKFRMLCEHDRIRSSSFSTHQLAAISGQKFTVIHSWFEAGILIADGEWTNLRDRKSSFTTAFACGVCGTLRRQGASLAALKTVADLFRSIGKPELEKVTV